jgi:thioredoxin reductase (NADPH)
MGIELKKPEMRPVCNPTTFESNVPGIYVAGVIVAGSRTSEIFIENGRFHGRQIADDVKTKLVDREVRSQEPEVSPTTG